LSSGAVQRIFERISQAGSEFLPNIIE